MSATCYAQTNLRCTIKSILQYYTHGIRNVSFICYWYQYIVDYSYVLRPNEHIYVSYFPLDLVNMSNV